ncbi:mono-functional DNA-alkylating methyl methanesulfonate N-term-domain-containing protein [Xylogone sp. PMI_703]|nr:mono-functional DNA-alkylating methyl methanesulfonate N-term-domain-containing protein [Xylogone sp. PMI_703]
MAHSKAVYGRVSMLQKIRPHGSATDHLFIGTQRFQYFTVSWNPETQQLDTQQSFVDVSERHVREAQSRDRCIVDPKGQYLLMELFEGILNLIKVTKPRKGHPQYLDAPEQIRITEFFVRSSTFIHTELNRPKLALLYVDGKDKVRLATYRLLDEKGQFSSFDPKDRENDIEDLDLGASHLIPVPRGDGDQKRYIVRNATTPKAQLGGVIIVGETKMIYLDDESKVVVEYALSEATIFSTWECVDNLRYLLADDYGALHLLTLQVDGAVVTGMEVQKIGQTSKATVLVYLGHGIVFVASHEGDSQIIRLDLDDTANPSLTLIQTIPNIAPILDFAVMDMGGREGETTTNEYSSGQARLVTGSGAFQDGSLRSVRSGVGLEDIGILVDVEDVRGLFALRTSTDSKGTHDTLLVSTFTETRIFRFDSQGEIEEVEGYFSLSQDTETLLAVNVLGDKILQVTTSSVLLLDQSGVIGQWTPPAGAVITAASASNGYVLLAAGGRTLVSLSVYPLVEIKAQELGNGDQVSCIHVPDQIPKIGIVGFWKSGSISILNLEDLSVIHSEDLRRRDNASVPRNIALAQVLHPSISGPTLFVAMEDGIVLSFNVDKSDLSLSGRKSVVLGTQQAQFRILPRRDGLFNVFATCEHPSLIYGSEGRVVYSAVTAESATFVCSFDSEAYPDTVIVATPENIKISQIDTERRTHVQKLHIGETVRRIAYSPKERAFGLGCIKREVASGEEVVSSSFRLVDEVIFGELGKPFALDVANGEELIESVYRAELPIQHEGGELGERFIVGTSYLEDPDPDSTNTKGRILIFGVDSARSPYLIAQQRLKGACRCISVMDGKIVAALTKTVVVYEYTEATSTSGSLNKLASYRSSTCPIDLYVNGNIIAIADLMKSVILVEYTKREDGLEHSLQEVARHYQASWATGVANIEEDSYLTSDAEGNLMVLRRNKDGVTLEDRKRLEVTSEINIGEMVNKMRTFEVETTANALVIPKAFLATTEGSIYLFATITAASQDMLMRLQTRMASIIQTPGNIDFNTYRSFKNSERETAEPFRFVDGELIERFLDVDESIQEEICKGLGPSVEDLRDMVEELKRLH